MFITQLRYFVAVVDCQSFTKAAARCHTSQSNLSEQVQNLEGQIGLKLLDRSGRKIVPTERGRLLWERAKKIIADVDEAVHAVRGTGTGTDRVSIGVISTIASCFLSHVLNSFVDRHPKIYLDIHQDSTAQLLPMIEVGNLDLGIVGLPLRRKGFSAETLFSEDMLLALHPKHPLTLKRTIFKEDLLTEKLILSHEGVCIPGCSLLLCKQKKFSPRIVFRSGQLDTIQSLVAAGKGISIIPQTAIAEMPTPLTFRKVANSKLKRSIAVVTRNNRPLKPSALAFLEHLRNARQTFKLPVAESENDSNGHQSATNGVQRGSLAPGVWGLRKPPMD